jgi:hypothetical protein
MWRSDTPLSRDALQVIDAAYDSVYPAEDDDAKPVEDNCMSS